MTEDELMQALRAAAKARADQEPDAAWDRLAAGTLTEAERADLLAQDGAEELEDLFSPLGPEFEDDLLESLLGQVGATDEPAAPLPQELSPALDVEPAPPATPANNRRWWMAVVPLVALAAALMLWVVVPRPGPTAELGTYTFEVQGGDQVVRGEPQTPTADMRQLSAGSQLTVLARPQAGSATAISGTVFTEVDGGLLNSGAQVQVAESGAVRWTGTAGTDPLVIGVDAIVLVVHTADATPSRVRQRATAGGPDVMRVPVQVLE